MNEPITRSEMYLAALGGEAVTPPEPITRMDMYMAYLNGMTDTYPDPITRTEQYLYKLCQNGMGGGGGVTIRNQNKTITENGSYKADSGYTGLGTVTVSVPQEEPVLQDKTVTENGTVTADPGYDGLGKVTVNVETDGGGDDVADRMADGTLETFFSENVTSLRNYACAFLANLLTIDLPNLTGLGAYVFNGCSALSNVNLPNLIRTDSSAFQECSSLENITMPSLKTMGVFIFRYCSKLKRADFKVCKTISASAFTGCTSLDTLILRNSDAVCTLSNTNSFNNTPFDSDGTGGTVYVPSALITQYQQATNWATLYAAGTCNFVAIEGSEYE